MTSTQTIMLDVFHGVAVLLAIGTMVATWAGHRRRPDDTKEVVRQRRRQCEMVARVLSGLLVPCMLAILLIDPEAPPAYAWIMGAAIILVVAAAVVCRLRPKR